MRGVTARAAAIAGLLLGALLAAAMAPVYASEPARPQIKPRVEEGLKAKARRREVDGNLVGHGGPVKAVRVSADGRYALTGSFDYAMMLWDLAPARPKVVLRLAEHAGAINAVAFVPARGWLVAAADDGTVTVYEIKSGRRITSFAGHQGKVIGLAVSPDGRLLASASWDRTVRLWNLETLTSGPVLSGHKGPVNAVAFSGDGRSLYSASYDGTIGLWRSDDGAFVRPLYKHGWGINVLERVPGSERLVLGALNGTVAMIDGGTGKVMRELPAHVRPVLALAVLAKPGLIATGAGDGTVRVLRLDDGALIEEHRNPYGPVWSLAFVPGGGRLFYAGLDDFVTLWQVTPRRPFEPVQSKFPRRFQVSGEVSEGERQFARKCSVCHTLQPDDRNRAGPTLHGVFGRRAGSLPGYPYSQALKRANLVWTAETIGKLFELGPDTFTPGSKMPLQRITDARQRQALIVFLKAASTTPAVREGEGKDEPGSRKARPRAGDDRRQEK
ncbi:MAG: cytochrome C [Hyphomicrobiaceae bacterium]|nr:cytochrome C [Hyphomicrobiaceae bacterium]